MNKSIYLKFLILIVAVMTVPFLVEARTRVDNRRQNIRQEIRSEMCERFSNIPSRRSSFCDDIEPAPPAPACSDGTDNDADGFVDANDRGCHTDFNENNANSYNPDADSENSPPTITLIGEAVINIFQGNSFIDSGATALDVEDGNLDSAVIISGVVNANTIGVYIITYNVTDSNGAAALPISRTVNVVTPLPPASPPPPAPACSDGIDNDGDGKIDFPEDLGCVSALDEDETNAISSGPTLTIVTPSNAPPARHLTMGSTGNILASFRFNSDNLSYIRITGLTITDTIGNGVPGKATIQSLTLWDGATQVAGPLSLSLSSASQGTATFNLRSFIVPRNSSKTLTLRGDVATFSSGGAVSGSSHTFSVAAASGITASVFGDPDAVVNLAGNAIGTTQTVYRTQLFIGANFLGANLGRTRVAVDDLAVIGFTADYAAQATLNAVTLKFSGSAIADGANFAVNLIDTSTNAPLGSATQKTCAVVAGVCSVAFEPSYIIDAGTTKVAKIRVDSGGFGNVIGFPDSMTVQIMSVSDIEWSDGTTSGIGLEATAVPFTVANILYE
jgi:hypothetical protein